MKKNKKNNENETKELTPYQQELKKQWETVVGRSALKEKRIKDWHEALGEGFYSEN